MTIFFTLKDAIFVKIKIQAIFDVYDDIIYILVSKPFWIDYCKYGRTMQNKSSKNITQQNDMYGEPLHNTIFGTYKFSDESEIDHKSVIFKDYICSKVDR